MEKIIEKEIMHAYCKNCSKEINIVWICKLNSIIGVRYIYFCSECQKPLGIFHEKRTSLINLNANSLVNNSETNVALS